MKRLFTLLVTALFVTTTGASLYAPTAAADATPGIFITSPSSGAVFPDGNKTMNVTAQVNDNGDTSILYKSLVLQAYTCDGSAQHCNSTWVKSAPFTLNSTVASVSVTINNVPLAFTGKNNLVIQLTDTPSSNGIFGYYANIPSPSGFYVTYSGTIYTPIERFYSPVVRRHMFTADENEINYVRSNMVGTWGDEGVAFKVKATADCKAGQSVYRFYSEYTQSHLYTMDENEKSVLIGLNNWAVWRYEGVAYCADKTQAAGTIPVYRFYAPFLNTHLYTTDTNEKNTLTTTTWKNVWKYEGIAYYAYPN